MSSAAPSADYDPNGVQQIYPTYQGKAQPWTLGFDDWASRFDPDGGDVSGDGKGTVITNDGSPRMDVFATEDVKSCEGNEDYAESLTQGYACSPNDWDNVEMTGYVRLRGQAGDDSDQDWTWYGPSGRHTNNGQHPEMCWGHAYKGSYHYRNAQVRFGKETWHVNYDYGGPAQGWVDVPDGVDYGENPDMWLGMKFIRYHFTRNGKEGIRAETWVDLTGVDDQGNPANNWTKVQTVEDHPDGESWGDGATDCNAPEDDQILLWGDPRMTFRWDDTDSQLRLASVREITPPGEDDPGDPPPDDELPVSSVDASADDGNVALNTIDDDLSTRWSAEGDGQWIRYDLGSQATVGSVAIAWYEGDQRTADFDVEISEDGTTWQQVHSGSSTGLTTDLETYDVDDATGRYLRIVGHGNGDNDWNSITEVNVLGSSQ